MNGRKWGGESHAEIIAGMRTALGILAVMAALAAYLAGGCATWRQKQHDEWVAKCGPAVDPLLKPCSCMDARTLSCPPPLTDATRKDGGAQ